MRAFVVMALLSFPAQVFPAPPAASPVAYPIAGLSPQQRPDGAPVLSQNPPPSPTALVGVSAPVPASIEHWLTSQGAWYTPFQHPGMPGPYDLRGWHQPTSVGAKR